MSSDGGTTGPGQSDRQAPDATPEHRVDVSGGLVGAIGANAQVTIVEGPKPASLESLVRVKDFETTIRNRTALFVGRQFVFDAIDAAMADPAFPSGYIVVHGEPGIGKTSLLSKLIVDRGYVHHLNSVGLGIQSNDAFLRNVCAQLILRFHLDRTVPDRISSDAGFLAGLLAEIAQDVRNLPLVIAIDALDEVQASDHLLLPPSLPDGVFVIATTRSGHHRRLTVDRVRWIHLRDDDPRNVRDVRAYIVRRIRTAGDEICRRISDWHASTKEFVRVLTVKCEGNFMYLSLVLDDLVSGSSTLAGLDSVHNLPQGLLQYYGRHWDAMRSTDEALFLRYQQPVICLLTSAREPVSIAQLFAWTRALWSATWEERSIPDPTRLKDVVQGWMEFLNVDQPESPDPRYRIYHASLRDWIGQEVGLTVYDDAISTVGLAKIAGWPGQAP